MITQTLKLNLIPGQVLPRVNVSQYDAGTRTLQMLLYNGDQAFNIPVGYGGFVQGTKPDRTGFQYAATVTEGSNVATLVVTQQMAAVSGEVTCELVIANGHDRIATVNFILYVEPAALADDTVISDTELPLIEEAAELAQRIDGIAADVEADADRAEAAADNAETWVSNYPRIGQNGNWFVFDTTTETFVDTGVSATGPQGPQGDDGPTGPQGPTGPTGNGIVSITKTGTSGLVDTYTILFTDGTTTTFTVTNGQDGQGSGDMTKAVYDSTNAVADAGGIVAYVAAHSGAGTLAGLDDVTLSSLAAGDTLVYNATTQKWENSTVIQTLTNQVDNISDEIADMTPYVQAISNPNLLDNPWFTVNQRGASSYTSIGYCVDRWYALFMDVSVVDNGISCQKRSGAQYNPVIRQMIIPTPNLRGKTLTLSIDIAENNNSVLLSVYKTVGINTSLVAIKSKANITGTGIYSFSFTVPNDVGTSSYPYLMVGIDLTSGNENESVTIRAVKLELGSVSTLAQDTAPNYATELLKCQRYFQIVGKNSTNQQGKTLAISSAFSTSDAWFPVYLPVAMRTTPTATLVGEMRVSKSTTGAAIASTTNGLSINVVNFNENDISLVNLHAQDTTNKPYTVGEVYRLITPSNVNSKCIIKLSADL